MGAEAVSDSVSVLWRSKRVLYRRCHIDHVVEFLPPFAAGPPPELDLQEARSGGTGMTPPSSADDNASSVRAAVSSGKHDTVLATSSVEMPHSQARK